MRGVRLTLLLTGGGGGGGNAAVWRVDGDVSPKACAEEIGYTFLPCVLAYLHRAPRLIPTRETRAGGSGSGNSDRDSGGGSGGLLHRDDVDAVVVPVRASSFYCDSACVFVAYLIDWRVACVQVNALGGPAVLTLLDRFRRDRARRGLIIAVADNPTTMAVTPETLLLDVRAEEDRTTDEAAVIVTVQSYLEAAGVMAAHKAGLFRPSLSPQVPSVPMTQL